MTDKLPKDNITLFLINYHQIFDYMGIKQTPQGIGLYEMTLWYYSSQIFIIDGRTAML